MTKQCTLIIQSLESTFDQNEQATQKVDSRASAYFQGAYTMWIKSVRGFDSTKHCAKCFVGEFIQIKTTHYSKPYELGVGYTFTLDSGVLDSSVSVDGEVLHYFCIVASPYDYNANIHAGFIYAQGHTIERVFKGQKITIENAKEIYFDDSVAREKYAHLPREFTTCRNFWFGAYYYG